MSEVGQILAQNMKRLRHERGLTGDALAELAGIDGGTIRKLEIGAVWIGKDMVGRLAQALSVSPSELFRSETPALPSPIDTLRVVAGSLGVVLPKGALEKATINFVKPMPSVEDNRVLVEQPEEEAEILQLARTIGILDAKEMLSHRASGEPIPDVRALLSHYKSRIETLAIEKRQLMRKIVRLEKTNAKAAPSKKTKS